MRKAPRQQRSQLMVNTIIEAATRVLARGGWANFKTSEVAEVAGVSIGSLYQYFPDKLGLAEEIRRRHLDDVLAALSGSDEILETSTLDHRVTRLIDGVIAVHSVNQPLHRILLEEVPLAARSKYAKFERDYQGRYQNLIATSSGKRHNMRDDVAGRVLAAAVEGVIHAAARHGELGSPVLKAELCQMIRSYLLGRSS